MTAELASPEDARLLTDRIKVAVEGTWHYRPGGSAPETFPEPK